LYRFKDGTAEVLLVHPGGPFWAKKDDGAWSIPKGEYETGEDPLDAAKREFEEETGQRAAGAFIDLGAFRQPSGKMIRAWALEADLDVGALKSNLFTMEWPPRSGRSQEFPEVDRAAWFTLSQASRKILAGQRPILAALSSHLGLDPAIAAAGGSAPDAGSD
jgi:predicted NUDIX family NTP pyrophosphohydrolase